MRIDRHVRPRRDAHRAAAVRIGAGVALRFRLRAPVPFRVLMLYDLSFVDRRQRTARDFILVFIGISVLLLALLIVLVAWLQLRRWVNVLIGDIRGKRFLDNAKSPRSSLPILTQVRQVLAEAEEQQRLEIDFRENWTPQALRQVVRDHLHSAQVIIVSNREPYIHNFDADRRPVVQVPASGMVTALEPIMRACSGVWIAHGAGDADRETVDRFDHIRVPPDDPSYTLRRVWLTDEQEQGYYYGFSNEGLWPLCHLAYVRPAFRPSDWRAYEEVNAKFADVRRRGGEHRQPRGADPGLSFRAAAEAHPAEECPRRRSPVLAHPVAQRGDLRRMPVEARDAAAHAVGGHSRLSHALSLPEFSRHGGSLRRVPDRSRAHDGDACRATCAGSRPIRYRSSGRPAGSRTCPTPAVCRAAVRERYHLAPEVDHRLGGRALGLHQGDHRALPGARSAAREESAVSRADHVCCRSPRRRAASCPPTRRCRRKPTARCERINAKFGEADWRPIVLIDEHQEPRSVFELYRAADFCLVNSLHDGMNLVAKEFVAARDDEDGVLILSTFAGASRELTEAVLINPFDVNETADAMEIAMRMGRDERRDRMSLMRRTVKENNVYRWAGRMLMDAARIRQRQSLRSAEAALRHLSADAATSGA